MIFKGQAVNEGLRNGLDCKWNVAYTRGVGMPIAGCQRDPEMRRVPRLNLAIVSFSASVSWSWARTMAFSDTISSGKAAVARIMDATIAASQRTPQAMRRLTSNLWPPRLLRRPPIDSF
jgi:hypothetical protein